MKQKYKNLKKWRVSTLSEVESVHNSYFVFVFFCSLSALSPRPMGFNNKPQTLAFAKSHCLTWRTLDLNFACLPNAFCAVSCHQEREGNIMQLQDFPSNSSFQPETNGPGRRLLSLGRNCCSSWVELQLSNWIWLLASFLFNLLSFYCFVHLLRHRNWAIETATATVCWETLSQAGPKLHR